MLRASVNKCTSELAGPSTSMRANWQSQVRTQVSKLTCIVEKSGRDISELSQGALSMILAAERRMEAENSMARWECMKNRDLGWESGHLSRGVAPELTNLWNNNHDR